jgi:hypothetical protein
MVLFIIIVDHGLLSARLSYKQQPLIAPSTCLHIVVVAGSGKRYWLGELTTLYVHINIMETKIKAKKG